MEDHAQYNASMPEPLQPSPSGSGLIRGFLWTVKAVLLSPRRFFPEMPIEGGLFGPYVFFLLCTMFSFLVSLGLNVVWGQSASSWVLLLMLAALVMPFVTTALLNFLFTRLLRTGGSYEATFRVVCYASAVNLFAWVPDLIILVLFQFYEIYLCALGLSVVHRTSLGRALLLMFGTLLLISFVIALVVQAVFPS